MVEEKTNIKLRSQSNVSIFELGESLFHRENWKKEIKMYENFWEIQRGWDLWISLIFSDKNNRR